MSRARSVHHLLGLARRAGAVVPGTAAVGEAVRSGEARLVLLARDASAVQLDKIRGTLERRSIPHAYVGDREALGVAVGLQPLSALAVTSASFADRLSAELGDAVLSGDALAAVEAAQE